VQLRQCAGSCLPQNGFNERLGALYERARYGRCSVYGGRRQGHIWRALFTLRVGGNKSQHKPALLLTGEAAKKNVALHVQAAFLLAATSGLERALFLLPSALRFAERLKAEQRASDRARKIAKRPHDKWGGATEDEYEFPPKPLRMRWATYRRLEAQYDDLENGVPWAS
jgi:hypothetical protein